MRQNVSSPMSKAPAWRTPGQPASCECGKEFTAKNPFIWNGCSGRDSAFICFPCWTRSRVDANDRVPAWGMESVSQRMEKCLSFIAQHQKENVNV